MSTSAATIAELDGSPSGAVLQLVSHPGTGRRELLIFRQGDPDQFRFIERTYSTTNPSSYCDLERFFDLREDVVIPTYTMASHPRREWTVEVLFGRARSPATFAFSDRKQVFCLQRLLTGYRPATQHYENVQCCVTYKNKRVPVFGRDQHLQGEGEIQFWKWPKAETKSLSPISSHAPTLHSLSDQARPSLPDMVRQLDVANVHTDHVRGRELLISRLDPPPLLVAFIRDKQGYKMLKTDGPSSLTYDCIKQVLILVDMQ
jgi:hypothetical protein